MSLIIICDEDGAVIVDNTSGHPLPMPIFETYDDAQNFLDWAEEEDLDSVYGPGDYYEADALAQDRERFETLANTPE